MIACTFCDDVRAHLATSSTAFAFEDEYPVALGHVLVVPRRHVVTYFDCTAEEKAEIWALVDVVRAKIMDRWAPAGFNVGFNAGDAAGQTVAHAHVHVIPRYVGDVADPRGGVRGVIPTKQHYTEVVEEPRHVLKMREALHALKTRALLHAPGATAEFSPATAASIAIICEDALEEDA